MNGGEIVKQCKICKQLFQPTHNAQRFCNAAHYVACPVCGQLMEWNSLRPARPCSAQCSTAQRIRTVQARYGVDNAVKIKPRCKFRSYDNLKYIQSYDRHYATLMKQHQIDVTKQDINSADSQNGTIELDANQMTLYVSTDTNATNFLRKYGVNKKQPVKRHGATLTLAMANTIYAAIRLEVSSFKNFSFQLTNLGERPGYRIKKGFKTLFNTAVELYEPDSVIAIIDEYEYEKIDFVDMRFTHKFSRPRMVYWDGIDKWTAHDNISDKLKQGIKPILGPVRNVYVWAANTKMTEPIS